MLSNTRTGGRTISLRGISTLTGRQGAAHYGSEVYRSLLEWAPLPQHWPEHLEVWTDKLAGTPAVDLLASLHDRLGLEWQRVAQLLRVSVPALNKWRRGGGLAPGTDLGLRRLVAFCELLSKAGVGDIGAWFASTPVEGIPLTRGDVYSVGGSDDLLASIHQPKFPEALLDRWLPRWRELQPARLFHPKVAFDDDGTVLVTLDDMPGVLGVGESIDGARRALVDELRDLARRWDAVDTPKGASAALFEEIRKAADDEELYRLVFGEP